MKLLRTYHSNGDPKGYFDYAARCDYGVSRYPGPDYTTRFVVDVYTGDGPRQTLSPPYDTETDALTELNRIAALIEGKAPAQGWVEGAPPNDGHWYLAFNLDGSPVAVHYNSAPHPDEPWRTSLGFHYHQSEFTHHLPTPIQPPKES